jgi:glycosyltransferase involved in cell wall biosynthesis
MRVALFFANAGRGGGGPEVYEMNLLRSLAALDKTTDYHVFCLDHRGPGKCDVHQDNIQFHILRPRIRPLSMLTDLPMMLRRYRPDVVHATFIPPPFPIPNLVYTLPCTAPFAKPEFYPAMIRGRLQYFFHLGVRTGRLVLCISSHVRQYLRDRFNRKEEHLPIVPLAASAAFRPIPAAERDASLRQQFGLTSPYFLFSGRWEPRKNVLRIIEAFARFKKSRTTDYKLVFTGERTWVARESFEMIARLNIAEDVIDLGKSPLSDLPLLYGGAAALVHPSLWESFGLVLLEAMRCGTPLITSDLSAIPEIAGDAALLVDPYRVDEIAEAMDRIASDAALQKRLSHAGLERSSAFSWERTARESLSAYRCLAAVN